MVGNRANSFLKTIEQSSSDMRAIVEAMRIFGYINEIEYSGLNTELTILSTELIRADGAETIELARKPIDLEQAYIDAEEIPGMIPREY
jgi:hypothetical protein